MSVLSCITVTLKDAQAETVFVDAFVKALEPTVNFPGLEKLIAAKVIGVEHTYHLHTEWETDAAMASWQSEAGYRGIRDSFDTSLVASIEIKRWVSA